MTLTEKERKKEHMRTRPKNERGDWKCNQMTTLRISKDDIRNSMGCNQRLLDLFIFSRQCRLFLFEMEEAKKRKKKKKTV